MRDLEAIGGGACKEWELRGLFGLFSAGYWLPEQEREHLACDLHLHENERLGKSSLHSSTHMEGGLTNEEWMRKENVMTRLFMMLLTMLLIGTSAMQVFIEDFFDWLARCTCAFLTE